MGKTRTDIIGLDVSKLINLLNKAYADEWFAYYQYWVSSKIVVGPMRDAAIAELTQHAGDELKHAGMLADRIIQLGGTPLTNPNSFNKNANCAYLEPTDPKVKAVIKLGVEGERCAIEVYNHLLEITKDKDVLTYNMILSILEDEVEHETDFEALLEDLKHIA
jgi:bacterioferritin